MGKECQCNSNCQCHHELKSECNNQWDSTPSSNLESCHKCNSGDKEKTATDNQWTSTNKN